MPKIFCLTRGAGPSAVIWILDCDFAAAKKRSACCDDPHAVVHFATPGTPFRHTDSFDWKIKPALPTKRSTHGGTIYGTEFANS